MKMYEKTELSSNELKYSFIKWVNKMSSLYKTVHYILLLEMASLYYSSCFKFGVAV